MLPLQEARVQSLVRKLRSRMLRGAAKKRVLVEGFSQKPAPTARHVSDNTAVKSPPDFVFPPKAPDIVEQR